MTAVPALVEKSFQEKCEILDRLNVDLKQSRNMLSKESLSNLTEALYKTNQLKTTNQILEILSIVLNYQSIHENSLAPHLVEKLGESREKTRELALECLVLLYSQSLFNEELIINAMQSKNYKQREMAILFVTGSYKKSKVSLKQFIPHIISNLEHSNESIRLTAKETLIELLQMNPEKQAMYNDVLKIFKKKGIRAGISDSILSEFNATINKQESSSLIKNFIDEQDVDLAEAETWPENISPPESPKPKSTQPLFLDCHHAEARIKQMVSIFQGKETEQNWAARHNELQALSSMIHGKSDISPSMKHLADVLAQSIKSLRTTMVLTCATTISELIYVYKTDVDVISDEIAPAVMKLLGNSKKLIWKSILNTCKLLFANTTLNTVKVNLLIASSSDKNSQIRQGTAEIVQLLLAKKKIRDFNHVDGIITKLVEDSDGSCRSMARSAFLYLQEQFPAPAKILFEKLNPSTQKTVNSHKITRVDLPVLDLEPISPQIVKYTPNPGRIVDLTTQSSQKATYGTIPPSAEYINDLASPLNQKSTSPIHSPSKNLEPNAEPTEEQIFRLLQQENIQGLMYLTEKCSTVKSLDSFKMLSKIQTLTKNIYANPTPGWIEKLFSADTVDIFINSSFLEWKHILIPLIKRMDQLGDFDKIMYTYKCSKNGPEIMEDLVTILGGKLSQKVTKYISDWIIELMESNDMDDYLDENCRKLCNKFIPMMHIHLVEPLANRDNECFKNVLHTFETEIVDYYKDLIHELTNISSEMDFGNSQIDTSHLVLDETNSNFDQEMNEIGEIETKIAEESVNHEAQEETPIGDMSEVEEAPTPEYLDKLEAEALICDDQTMEVETDIQTETPYNSATNFRDGPSGLVGAKTNNLERSPKQLKYSDDEMELQSLVDMINTPDHKNALSRLYRFSRLYHKNSSKYSVWSNNFATLLNTILVGLVEDAVDVSKQEYMLIVLQELVLNQHELISDLKIVLEILFSCRSEGSRVSAASSMVLSAICSTYDSNMLLGLLFEIFASWDLSDVNNEAYRVRRNETQPILQPPPICSLLHTLEQLIKNLTASDQIQHIVDQLTPILANNDTFIRKACFEVFAELSVYFQDDFWKCATHLSKSQTTIIQRLPTC
ncbi:suppressor of tub2 mutation [Terramyces sp. JEL0728]|nr:suppressor of tub2 mutation [Terramyces sp. JEL0728]